MTSITTPRRSQTDATPDSLPPLGDAAQSISVNRSSDSLKQVRVQEPYGEPYPEPYREPYVVDHQDRSETGSVQAWTERPETARNPKSPVTLPTDEELVVEHEGGDNGGIEQIPRRSHHRAWTAQTLRGRERTYDVNLVTTNMPLYEPLLDEYLADYFNSPKIRAHLQKLGLIDAEGNIIDPKRFKHNQIKLDRDEYQTNIMKRMEELAFDREVEVAIRRQNEEDKTPRSQKLRKTVQAPASALPYPEFLSHYPATMTRTALLYAEKPASLTKAEEMLVARLRQQAPRKLKALGMTPELLSAKDQHGRSEAREERRALWKAAARPNAVVASGRARSAAGGGGGAKEGEKRAGAARPTTAAGALQQRKKQNKELVVHDDLSGEEWEGLEGHEVTTQAGGRKKKLHEDDSVTNLFEVAKLEYQSGNMDDAETHVRKILQKVGRPGSAAATTTTTTTAQEKTPPKGLFAESTPTTAPPTRPTSAAISKLRSGRSTPSTPRHRSFRPKSARPTRESHFPIASDFSDFDAGSEGGYESDGEVCLSDDQVGDSAVTTVVVGSKEPIKEEEEVIKATIEQTVVEPTAEDEAAAAKHAGEENRDREAQDSSLPPQTDDYDADFEQGEDTQAPADDTTSAPGAEPPSSTRGSTRQLEADKKYWDVMSVDAVVEHSARSFPRTADNSAFDVYGTTTPTTAQPSRSNTLLAAAAANSAQKQKGAGRNDDGRGDGEDTLGGDDAHEAGQTNTTHHRSTPELNDQQYHHQPLDPLTRQTHSAKSSPNVRGTSLLNKAAGIPLPPSAGPSTHRLTTPAAGSTRNMAAKVTVSSPLAKSTAAKSSPNLGRSAADDAAGVALPPSAAASTANVYGNGNGNGSLNRPGSATSDKTANASASASRPVIKSTPHIRAATTDSVDMAAAVPLPPSAAQSTANVRTDHHTRSTSNLKHSSPALQNAASPMTRGVGAQSTPNMRRGDSPIDTAAAVPLPPSAAHSTANVSTQDRTTTHKRSTGNVIASVKSTATVALQKGVARSASLLSKPNTSMSASTPIVVKPTTTAIDDAAAIPLPPSIAPSTSNLRGSGARGETTGSSVRFAQDQIVTSPHNNNTTTNNTHTTAYASSTGLSKSARSTPNVHDAADKPAVTTVKTAIRSSSPALSHGKGRKSAPDVRTRDDASGVDHAAGIALPASVASSTAHVNEADPAAAVGMKSTLDIRAGANADATQQYASEVDQAAGVPLPRSVAPSTANLRSSSAALANDQPGSGFKSAAQSSPNLNRHAANTVDYAAGIPLPGSVAQSTADLRSSSSSAALANDQPGSGFKSAAQSSPNLNRHAADAVDYAAGIPLPGSVAPSTANLRSSNAALANNQPHSGSQQLVNAAAKSSPSLNRHAANTVDYAAGIPLPGSGAPSTANLRSSNAALANNQPHSGSQQLVNAAAKSSPNLNRHAADAVDYAAGIPLPGSGAPSTANLRSSNAALATTAHHDLPTPSAATHSSPILAGTGTEMGVDSSRTADARANNTTTATLTHPAALTQPEPEGEPPAPAVGSRDAHIADRTTETLPPPPTTSSTDSTARGHVAPTTAQQEPQPVAKGHAEAPMLRDGDAEAVSGADAGGESLPATGAGATAPRPARGGAADEREAPPRAAGAHGGSGTLVGLKSRLGAKSRSQTGLNDDDGAAAAPLGSRGSLSFHPERDNALTTTTTTTAAAATASRPGSRSSMIVPGGAMTPRTASRSHSSRSLTTTTTAPAPAPAPAAPPVHA